MACRSTGAAVASSFVGVVILGLAGCAASPFDSALYSSRPTDSAHAMMPIAADAPESIYRTSQAPSASESIEPTLNAYIEYALFHSPEVERSYQDWRASSERLPQVRSLPDPRLKLGFFVNEVETRVGAQQAKVGIEQSFPWIGTLKSREDSAARGALVAWYRFQNAQLLSPSKFRCRCTSSHIWIKQSRLHTKTKCFSDQSKRLFERNTVLGPAHTPS